MRPVLAIFSKAPAMGRSKTRLAREIGAVRAWQVKRELDRRTLALASGPAWEPVLHVTAPADCSRCLPRVWPQPGALARRWQGRGGLGVRLERACRAAAARGQGVILIGTDCPGLERRHLRQAARGVRGGRAVVGPATDGGFWLLGLPAAVAARIRLAGVRWSCAATLDDTLATLPATLRVIRLPTLDDIDTAADLAAWQGTRRHRR